MPVFGRAYFGSILLAAAPVGAELIKTGQTTSFATGDDGDIEAGRAVDFLTLATNNPFGNASRFTALDGTQTITNDIFIDWSTYDNATVLGYYRGSMGVNRTWEQALAWAAELNPEGYTGWRIPNIKELQNLANFDFALSSVGGYSPVNLIGTIWSSTTASGNSSNAVVMSTATGDTSSNTLKTQGRRTLACRTFTVTGTTLT